MGLGTGGEFSGLGIVLGMNGASFSHLVGGFIEHSGRVGSGRANGSLGFAAESHLVFGLATRRPRFAGGCCPGFRFDPGGTGAAHFGSGARH